MFDSSKNKTFELVLFVKDKFGNPTKTKRSISTDSPDELSQFWMKHKGKPRKKKTNKKLPTEQQAKTILKNIYKDTEGEDV